MVCISSHEFNQLNWRKNKMAKTEYSFFVGLWKTVKNSAFLLLPFVAALIATVPAEYAWIAGPLVYFLKNLYTNKTKK